MPDRDLTTHLRDLTTGDQRAGDRLLDAVYDELRDLAERKIAQESAGHTLQATALVHEAYMKLIDQERVSWQGRTHFKAVAAQAMGRILIDHARRKKRAKRGGGWRRVTFESACEVGHEEPFVIADVCEALEKMRALDEQQTRIVEMRLFGDLSADETARLLDVSKRTVERDWKMGLAWLRRELCEGPEDAGDATG